ncbi:MAG: hypothetical protein LUF89_05585 [Ruminococcus sp.]|nr:hypothetical protein [Ruminococcus sp.]
MRMPTMESKSPIKPPRTDKLHASQRNWSMICFRLAPMAFRIPISLVRSDTDTIMIFIIPIPPTTSEIAAMPARSSDIVLVTSSMVSSTSELLLTV